VSFTRRRRIRGGLDLKVLQAAQNGACMWKKTPAAFNGRE
jgi:hypothetical protein